MSKNVTDNPKTCVMCEIDFMPTGNRQTYCVSCRKERERTRDKERHKRRYQPKGYAQLGTKNNNWKGGIAGYRQKALEHYGSKCNSCGTDKNIVVHHKDENRYNNDLSNLEVLCRKCHFHRHDLTARNFEPHKEINRKKTIARNKARTIRRHSQRP